ncbi:MAG: hypothetical protein R2800_04995 [Flavipsychrobacter sp.]
MNPQIVGGLLYIPTIYFAYLAYKKFMEMRAHGKKAKEQPSLKGDKEYEEEGGRLLRRFNTLGLLTLAMYLIAFRVFTSPSMAEIFAGW